MTGFRRFSWHFHGIFMGFSWVFLGFVPVLWPCSGPRGVDLSAIAKQTPGMSGADLANLLNEGAIVAARQNKTETGPKGLDVHRCFHIFS